MFMESTKFVNVLGTRGKSVAYVSGMDTMQLVGPEGLEPSTNGL